MNGARRRVRLGPAQLCVVAAASALATALVITTALGRSPAQSAALAALKRRPMTVTVAPPSGGSAPAATPAPAPAASAPVVPTSTPPPAAAAAATQPAATQPSAPVSPSSPAPAAASAPPASPATPSTPPPKVGHVFVIGLSAASFDAAFGAGSVAHYLNHTLRSRGTLLGGYETLGSAGLPDYLAMISGQPPNLDTSAECSTYAEFPAGTTPAADGQVSGDGCVYPNTVLTIGDQVTAAGKQWRAYIQDMGATSCAHPNSNAAESGPLAGAGPAYAPLHNPFIFFHSLLDLGGCASSDVSLDQLSADLRSANRTPSYAFIAPDACLDAGISVPPPVALPCPPGKPTGLAGEDAFLQTWVPRILDSPAYRRNGALIITFSLPDSSAVPGTVPPTSSAPTGALVISRHAGRGKIVSSTYTPYSVLRTVEDLLGLKPLARAARAASFAGYVTG